MLCILPGLSLLSSLLERCVCLCVCVRESEGARHVNVGYKKAGKGTQKNEKKRKKDERF